jgi:hypothetical protein
VPGYSAACNDFLIADDVGRHQVNRVADRPDQRFALQRGAVELAGEVRVVGGDVEGGDHAALAQVFDLRVVGQRGEGGADFCRFLAVDRNHVVLLEDVERRQRGAAGERVAGVGMRVQEGAGDRVVEEGVVDVSLLRTMDSGR